MNIIGMFDKLLYTVTYIIRIYTIITYTATGIL